MQIYVKKVIFLYDLFYLMRFITTPKILRLFYPSLLWGMPKEEKKLYITFDDGPHPTITPQVLEILKEFNAKATFFCIGKNIEANNDVFNRIIKEGHSVGNHTFNHNKGWKTKTKDYIDSVNKTENIINSLTNSHGRTALLRPPYGKIKSSQIRNLKRHYKLVAWTVISYDWDKTLSPEECFNNVIRNAANGSIIVFHDSEKAVNNMIPTLKKILRYYSEKGFIFESL